MNRINDVPIPRIKDVYEVVPSADGLPHVRSGDEIVMKVAGEKGLLLGQMLLAIDGRKSIEQLVNEFQKVTDRATLLATVDFLFKEGIIEQADASDSSIPKHLREQAKYLSHYVADPKAAIKILANTNCLVVGEESLIRMLSDEMAFHGFDSIDTHATLFSNSERQRDEFEELHTKVKLADLVVVVHRTFSSCLCPDINRCCLEHRKPVLFADLSSGNHGVVGPLCVPGQSSCYSCYESRLTADTETYHEHADYEAFARVQSSPKCSFGRLKALEPIVNSLIIVELISYLTGYRAPRTIDGTLIVDLFQTEIYHEPVLKMPGCGVCDSIRESPARNIQDCVYESN
ncbi:MAG: TOMM precursor leader peptide-binding protein [Desulfobacteraceae bacterium]|nr:TOMM precursor leader peptide-binding protein [Desulfobacteraceae bacterium]